MILSISAIPWILILEYGCYWRFIRGFRVNWRSGARENNMLRVLNGELVDYEKPAD
jgi:hypothetical protein